jgi:Asp-tRNA(Asn)/Glu-tRNA(Gln) amidotransferase C subunit
MKNKTKPDWKLIAKKIYIDLDSDALNNIQKDWEKVCKSFLSFEKLDIEKLEPTNYCHKASASMLREDVPSDKANNLFNTKDYIIGG